MKRSVTQLVIGVAIGCLVGAGLAGWWLGRAAEDQVQEGLERAAVVDLRALTDVLQAVSGDGATEGAAQRVAEHWQAASGGRIETVRVVQGRQLAASTATEDQGDKAAPRRLSRDEKELFDTAQRLRTSIETNHQDDVARKEEIEVTPTDAGGLDLAGPLLENGDVVGAVLVRTAPEVQTSGTGVGGWLAVLLAALLPALALLLLAATGKLPRAALIAAAVVLLLAGVVGYGIHAFSDFRAQLEAKETGVAERVEAALERARPLARDAGVSSATLEPAAWDVDRYRRPFERLELGGGGVEVRPEAIAELAAAGQGSWRKNLAAFVLLALVVGGFIGLGGARRLAHSVSDNRQSYYYVAPAMFGMLVLVFFPFFYGIALSFTNQNIYNTDQPISDIWVGLDNYVEIVTDFDLFETTESGERNINYENFWWTLFLTIVWTVSNVTVGVSVGLLLALILNTKNLRGKSLYRVLLILPWAVPNYITALIWKGMFHSQFGVINQVLQIFGFESVSWFDTTLTSFMTVLATNGWLSFPFMMVISLGALQSIPADLYEAARVDGASRWQRFRSITLPMLKPALIPAIILSVIWTFNMFNIIYLVSEGEPGGSTEILITAAYKLAFEQYRYGYAAAYSTVIFGILLVYGVWQIRVTRATEGI